jgi:hypothetical protein
MSKVDLTKVYRIMNIGSSSGPVSKEGILSAFIFSKDRAQRFHFLTPDTRNLSFGTNKMIVKYMRGEKFITPGRNYVQVV